MGKCNREIKPSTLPTSPTVSWHCWAGSCWGKVELETHGGPLRTIKTLWVLYRATRGPDTPLRGLCTPWCGPCGAMGTLHSPQAPHTPLGALQKTCQKELWPLLKPKH